VPVGFVLDCGAVQERVVDCGAVQERILDCPASLV